MIKVKENLFFIGMIIVGTLLLILSGLFGVLAFGTVSTGEEIRQFFSCNGSSTTYTFTIPGYSSSEYNVYKRVISTGAQTPLVESLDYTIAPTNDNYLNGGVVTISPALASTYKVIVAREITQSQETASSSMTPSAAENALDKLTRQIQDLQEKYTRTIRLPESDVGIDIILENSVYRAGKYLAFSSDGNTAYPYAVSGSSESTPHSAFAVTLADDVNSAMARGTLDAAKAANGFVDVTEAPYCATGNSTTDDTNSIQAAINSLTDGIVFFPNGTYKITSKLNVGTKDIYLEGCGLSSIIYNANTAGADTVEFGLGSSNSTGRGVRNMRIQGNVSSGNGVYLNGATGMDISNTLIDEHGGYGIKFGGTNHTIYNTIYKTGIRDNNDGGIYMQRANHNTFIDCWFNENDVYGLYVLDWTDNLKFIGCSFESQGQNAIYVDGYNADLVRNSMCMLFQGCWFENNCASSGTDDIYLSNTNDIIFQNCYGPMDGAAGDTYLANCDNVHFDNMVNWGGVEFDPNCGRNYITNCTIHKIIDKSFNAKITNCRVYNTATAVSMHKPLDTVSYQAEGENNLFIRSSFDNAANFTAGGGGVTVTYVTDDGWYDNKCAKITFDTDAGANFASKATSDNSLAINTDKRYLIGFMAKSSIADNFKVILWALGEGFTLVESEFYIDTTWRRYLYLTANSTTNSGTGNILLGIHATPASSTDLYIDDIFVYEFDEAEVPKYLDKGIYIPTKAAAKQITNAMLAPMRFVGNQFQTEPNDAHPSVAKGNLFLSGGATTITDFDDGVEGQIITFIAEHAITITDGTNIFLSGSANFVMGASDTLTLVCNADGKWYEISRSDN